MQQRNIELNSFLKIFLGVAVASGGPMASKPTFRGSSLSLSLGNYGNGLCETAIETAISGRIHRQSNEPDLSLH